MTTIGLAGSDAAGDGGSGAAERAVRAGVRRGGSGGPAVHTEQDSVDLWRVLADANPDAYRPDLAVALAILADAQLHAGHVGLLPETIAAVAGLVCDRMITW